MNQKLKSVFVVPGPGWIAIATAVIGLLQTYFNDWTMTGGVVTALTVLIKGLQMATGVPEIPDTSAVARSMGGAPEKAVNTHATRAVRFLFGA